MGDFGCKKKDQKRSSQERKKKKKEKKTRSAQELGRHNTKVTVRKKG